MRSEYTELDIEIIEFADPEDVIATSCTEEFNHYSVPGGT